ncbi:unnamed protein product [Mesocestoides corti]|uniref:Uncharacterized protein n=1 Tax=Mesocestoides corti TaxID=53468 RepID=A0A0R3U5I9_MESCO|nr:unnamed protein product [Mesocestoides corti]
MCVRWDYISPKSSEFALAPPKQFPNQFFTQKEVSAEDASQSTGDSLSDIRNEELELIENQQDAKNDDPLDLRLTVHSTLSSNTGFAGNRGGDVLGKRDRSGPASPSISLMPSLLLIAAGSLEAAVELFGKKLAKRLGLNENSAAVACVSLRRSNPVYISIEKPVMDAERSDNPDSVEDDPGIVQVYAGNITGIAKTSSPTSDALDSAEANSIHSIVARRGPVDIGLYHIMDGIALGHPILRVIAATETKLSSHLFHPILSITLAVAVLVGTFDQPAQCQMKMTVLEVNEG